MEETPANEKSCQTDEITGEAAVPGPDHASKTLVYSTEPGDPPLLQTPLLTSKSGIQQIIECFRTGTAQLKHILLKEVDTIFECKLCRSLFRGLPNLIKHKEIYCFTRMPEPDGVSGDGKKSIKELLEAIYPQSDKEEYILKLEPIAGNQNAVYQYLSKEDNLPPSSRSPNHTTKDSWRHYHSNSQEPYMEEVQLEEEENNFIDEEEESENMEKGEEDAEKRHQDSEEPEEPTEEACDKDLAPCKCLICNRTYRVRGHLRRHLWTVHKIVSSGSTTNSSDSTSSSKKMPNGKVPDNPNTSPSSLSDTQNQKSPKEDKVSSKAQFSIGFDFKACFCKLCRRTFSSVQNLEKHIELHTDNGTDFFVKFYCCPLCRYKTRRKRDVLRHLSELHKKKSSYLSRISQSLESYAVKKPAEVVLNKEEEKVQGRQEEVNVHHNHTSPYLTRRNLPPKAPGIVGKKTLKTSNKKRHNEEVTHNKKLKPSSPKGGATKKSLHVCNICGQSFKKTRYLGLHKRSHLKSATRSAGIRTRSKVML
ncbi:zinc finger protein 800-like [Sinocyclocheilus anshuiensis]|uniref:Zinc finger protein 800-like n=1 Tax=Sinocyclocheilus anshuiensis TaxID=1608454 RepID=A0A671T3G8_9TELE|nr:PREDICTED: zinc finger protein 800-like [Sinocyclocheilus anshuiensis]XP_016303163.1 PREDICTED: zinc finger protein 800-like [Sinocyclocheilus anshuiensis]XP_016303164.1 PREDICTED: zinc finger protein 800-like [Sinocyclocheilus anshuiensis]XP_016303165.1 PREDICTED: zinc finger protein 800-like [Sinocyclocheilus anshuiensis]